MKKPFSLKRQLTDLLATATLPNFSSRAAEQALDDWLSEALDGDQEDHARAIKLLNDYRDPRSGVSVASFVTHYVGHGWPMTEDDLSDPQSSQFIQLLMAGVNVFETDAKGRHPALRALTRNSNLIPVEVMVAAFDEGLHPFAVDTVLKESLFSTPFLRDTKNTAPYKLIQEVAQEHLSQASQHQQDLWLSQISGTPLRREHAGWVAQKRADLLATTLPAAPEQRGIKPRF